VVAEEAFTALKAPIVRLGGPDAPVASSYPLEQAFVPQALVIAAAAERLCCGQYA
jgi:pyruvate dehydrogenase E1 component beta subunit